ncbi:MAG TPA: hypothetical protein VKM93_07245 [Terriglobia bacterium]|nr:hypothetical protein [Terriglobia bacterium]
MYVACPLEGIAYFLGPISRFATGDEKPKTLLEFVRRWTEMKSNILQLVPSETPAGTGCGCLLAEQNPTTGEFTVIEPC